MTKEWELLYQRALEVTRPRQVSAWLETGGVGAALLSRGGNLYTGVCVDTACSLGMCAERAAVAAMLTAGEDAVARVCAVSAGGRVMPPCGACRELLSQLGEGAWDTEVLLDNDGRTARLRELLPEAWNGEEEQHG